MRISAGIPVVVALTAVLSAPAVFAAQPTTTDPAAHAAGTPAAPVAPGTVAPIAPAAPVVTGAATTPSDDSTYLTADAHIRASKLVGASVYNGQNEKVGSIDEVLIGQTDNVYGVVLSVGGFLGIASKLVEVPFSQIQVTNDKLLMAGATKDALTSLPEYKYKSRS